MDHAQTGGIPEPFAHTSRGTPLWPIAGGSGDPGDGDPPVGDPPTDPPAGDPPADGEDTAGLKSALQKERADRKAADKRAKDLEKRLTDLENAGKSEEEKRTARLAELEKQNESLAGEAKAARTDASLTSAAIEAKAKRPSEVVKLVDRSLIEYDDAGNVRNAADVVANAKERVPELFTGGKPSGDADGGPRGKTAGGEPNKDMERLLRTAAGH